MPPKLARLISAGQLVHAIDGSVYRVLSTSKDGDGFTFKLANLQGQPCPIPADFHPVNPVMARFASLLRILSYNKDLTKIVNSMIEQHGFPTDPKMDWSAYVQEAMAPALAAVSPDFDLQDEAIYQVIVRALLDRDILADFPTAIKKFPPGVQKLPVERQVSEYLKKAFVWRIQEAKKYMQTVQPSEEMSLEQPAHDTESGESYSLLDTEEHATGTEDYADADAERDFKAFHEEFYRWSVKKNKASAFGLALLLTIYWEQVQQAEGELKFGDLTQEWLRRSHLGFDSLKAYNTKLPQVLKDFVQSNVGVMKGKYELMDLIGFLLPKKKEKARPAKASSKSAAGVEGDIAQAKSETDSPGAIDPDIKAALGISVPMEKFAMNAPQLSPEALDAGKQMTLDEFMASNDWTDPFEESDKWIEKEGMLGHDFADADQQAIRPDITPGDTGRLPHARTQGSVKEGAVPAGALDIDQPVGVPTENWQCLNCGHEGMLSQHGKCEACGSDAVASTLPAPPEYARYGIDPLKKSGRSLQVLECCGSVTGYHKMDCPVYTKNFDETVARLKALGKRSALKAAGKWMVTLRDARGRTREQVVSAGENFGSAERAVQKYMKRGENIVFIMVASKRAAAPAPAAAPAQAAPAPAPAPATPAVAPPSVVAPPPGTPLALQQQETPEEPLRHTVPPEIPNRKYHMTSRVLTIAQKHRLEKW